MIKIENLVAERDKYDTLMLKVMDGKLHLSKEDEVIPYPPSEKQKEKDMFLYKYYEYHFNRLEKLINSEITNK